MKRDEVKKKAKGPGIMTGLMKKGELIRQIQRTEGNFACFGTAKDYCDR